MIVKVAKINLILDMLQIYVINITDKKIFSKDDNVLENQLKNSTYILKKDLNKLEKEQLICSNPIILNIIQDISPLKINNSCDIEIKSIQLKKIQDLLLQMDYQVKIII